MTATEKKDPFSVYDKVEELRTEYLRELSSLAKIFISLAIAIVGLTMSQAGPDLSGKAGVKWLVGAWVTLVLCAISGFLEIYFFSSRFKLRADYLYASHLVDLVVQLLGSDEKLREFDAESRLYKKQHDRRYYWCVGLTTVQAVLLLTGLILFALYMYANFCKG